MGVLSAKYRIAAPTIFSPDLHSTAKSGFRLDDIWCGAKGVDLFLGKPHNRLQLTKRSTNLQSDYRTLPAPLDTSQRALFISGVNRSDDLFMYWRGQMVGLSPGTRYRASLEVEFATNAQSGCGVSDVVGEK